MRNTVHSASTYRFRRRRLSYLFGSNSSNREPSSSFRLDSDSRSNSRKETTVRQAYLLECGLFHRQARANAFSRPAVPRASQPLHPISPSRPVPLELPSPSRVRRERHRRGPDPCALPEPSSPTHWSAMTECPIRQESPPPLPDSAVREEAFCPVSRARCRCSCRRPRAPR